MSRHPVVVLDDGDLASLLTGGSVTVRTTAGRLTEVAMFRLGVDRVQAAIVAAQRAVYNVHYFDDRYPPRECDRCGNLYQGPAVYCGLECAIEDAH